ncbi:MAG: ankyrin repeat domain-containing protein, partial [Candidatus Anstonellales archaeon]
SGFTESGNAFHNKQPLVEKEKNTIKNTIEEKKKEILSLADKGEYEKIAEMIISDKSRKVGIALKGINKEKAEELMENEYEQMRENAKLINSSKNGDIIGVVKAFLNGADVNAKDKYGNTALIWATENNNTDIVELLIKAEVDVNVQDKDGRTALMYAAKHGNTEIVKLLRKGGAAVNQEDNYGWTATMYAAYYSSNKEIFWLLIK